MMLRRRVRLSDIAGWSSAIVVALLAGKAVADLEWPLHVAVVVGAVALAGLAVAMIRDLHPVALFCASVMPISAFSGIMRDVSLGPITVLGAWTGLCLVVAGLLWLASARQIWIGSLWPFALLILLGVTTLASFPLTQRGLQNLLVLSVFVFTTLLTASYVATSNTFIPTLSVVFALSSWIPVVVYGVSIILWGLGNDILVGPRGLALFALVALAWNLSRWRYGIRAALAPIVGILATIIFSLSRLAIVVALVLLPLSRISSRPKTVDWLRVILATGLSIGLFYAAFNYIPPLQERFVEGDVATLGGVVTINVSGRDGVWSATWQSYRESPWFGKGVGSAESVITARGEFVVSHPHNEYLRILHDFGAIGLLFWLWGFCLLLGKTWGAWRRSNVGRPEEASVHLAAFLLLVTVALAMITDNAVAYVHVMGPLGVVVGSSLGLSSSATEADSSGDTSSATEPRGTVAQLQPVHIASSYRSP